MGGGFVLSHSGKSVGERPTSIPGISLYTILLTLQACIGGLLFGYDTGIVSSAMLFLPDSKGMNHLSISWQELIVSITPGMAGIGSLVAGQASDRFGRRPIILAASGLFFIGACLCAAALERWMLLGGRVLLGIAIGFASMIIPVFISEGSPSHIRGMLVTVYQFMIASGFIVANAVAAGFAHINPYNVGWRLMFGAAGIPAAVQFIGFLFLPDTPRFYMAQGREEEATKVLEKVYSGNREWVDYEIDEIKVFLNEEEKQKSENGNSYVITRILKTAHVRRALLLGCAMQMFQQLIGINTILYYTGTIIQSAGVRDKITTIWISCGISAVQSVGTLAPMKLIERLGRRPILLWSLLGTIISLCLMGGAFVAINQASAKIDPANAYNGIKFDPNSNNKTIEKCAAFSNCDYCTTSQDCGFCHPKSDAHHGQCLPIHDSGNKDNSSVGYCASTSANYTFDAEFCVTNWTIAPIIVMVIYLLCFAFGMGPMPWVFNSEIYPLWARGTCVSIATFTNWTFNLLVSLTFLSLGEAIHKYGAFFLYAGISSIGLVLFYFFIPETKGLPIEEVEELFKPKSQRRHKIQPTISDNSQKYMMSSNFSTLDGEFSNDITSDYREKTTKL